MEAGEKRIVDSVSTPCVSLLTKTLPDLAKHFMLHILKKAYQCPVLLPQAPINTADSQAADGPTGDFPAALPPALSPAVGSAVAASPVAAPPAAATAAAAPAAEPPANCSSALALVLSSPRDFSLFGQLILVSCSSILRQSPFIASMQQR